MVLSGEVFSYSLSPVPPLFTITKKETLQLLSQNAHTIVSESKIAIIYEAKNTIYIAACYSPFDTLSFSHHPLLLLKIWRQQFKFLSTISQFYHPIGGKCKYLQVHYDITTVEQSLLLWFVKGYVVEPSKKVYFSQCRLHPLYYAPFPLRKTANKYIDIPQIINSLSSG